MKKNLLTLSLLLTSSLLWATDYYWVGGAGNWSDINHWATTSGGAIKHSIVPGADDDVYFDANSGLLNGHDVQLPSSGSAYCRNMSWAGVTTRPYFRNSGGFILYVYGSVELSGTVYYGWQDLHFVGPGAATLQTNGASRYPQVGWYNRFTVNKPGGSVTVLDNLPSSLVVYDVTLTAGALDLSGASHWVGNRFRMNGTNVRSLDISNATLNVGAADFTGANLTVSSAGSYIVTTGNFYSDNHHFPRVDIGTTSDEMQINHTSFGQLTFTNPNALPATVRIGQSNTISRLEFKSSGCIRYGGNVIDSLILAPSKQHRFFQTNTVTKYFQLNSPDCEGLGELIATNYQATLEFNMGVELDLYNVYVQNIVADHAGGGPVVVQGADGGNTEGWSFNAPAAGTTLYWVGGAGNWNDAAHWSLSSGGPGGACIPFSADDVIFDANSGFTAGNNTVTTTGSAWCHNMSWAGVAGSPVFNESGSHNLEVWGSVVLDPTVTMNAELYMRGNELVSFTSNGNTLGNLRINIEKSSVAGGVSFTDDLVNTNTYIRLGVGQFLAAGRTFDINQFTSGSGQRVIDVSGATITTAYSWWLTGTGRTWVNNAAGLSLTSNGNFGAEGLHYPRVILTSDLGSFSITGVSFGRLSFTNPSPSSAARLLQNNTLDTLEFSGAGIVGSGTTVNTLLLAPSRNYFFAGTTNVLEKLSFVSPSCSGLGEMRGSNSTVAVLNFGAGAVIEMDNVYLENMTASGSGVPISVNGADAGGNTGFIITASSGGDRYWVGGGGDWNDAAHWSLTSGGPGGACVPTVNDNVFFDANSFPAPGAVVTTTLGNAYCASMNWTGAANDPVFNESPSFAMETWGDVILNPAVTMNARIDFRGTDDNLLTVNGSNLGTLSYSIEKPGGSVKLTDDLDNPLTEIFLTAGGLDLSGRTLVVAAISDQSTARATWLDISDAAITASWRYTGAAKNLVADNSTIRAAIFHANGGVYNNVAMTTTASGNVSIVNTTFNYLLFENPAAGSAVWIGAGNSVGTLEFRGGGSINGTGNVLDTLILSPGKIYTLAANSTTTVNDALYGSGTPCNLTEIVSSSATANASIVKTNGGVSLDYIRIRRITASGSTPFEAGPHSIDQGNNNNWDIAPYNGSSPIAGLGDDIMLAPAEFPYTLHTDGFFGSPLATYLWNDNSTLDHLVITEPGTYSVTVSFPDGCSVSDAITVSLASTLPVTLEEFRVREQDCQALLQWKATDAIHFASFTVERSRDGIRYEEVETISYQDGQAAYQFTDRSLPAGKTYYRLRLTDLDGSYRYSPVAAVSSRCAGMNIQAYPTITRNVVNVILPAGFEQVVVRVINTAGQLLPVRVQQGGSQATVDLAALAPGNYILQVISPAGSRSFRIIKTN